MYRKYFNVNLICSAYIFAVKLIVCNAEIRMCLMIFTGMLLLCATYKQHVTFHSRTMLVCHIPIVSGIPLVVCYWFIAVEYQNSMLLVFHRHIPLPTSMQLSYMAVQLLLCLFSQAGNCSLWLNTLQWFNNSLN